MKRFPLSLAVALAACAPSAEDVLIDAAQAAITAQLANPAGATFRNVRLGADPASRRIGMVCGEVSDGVGYRRFLYGRASGLAQVEYLGDPSGFPNDATDDNKALFDLNWRDSCV